jgi:hypothetical protein
MKLSRRDVRIEACSFAGPAVSIGRVAARSVHDDHRARVRRGECEARRTGQVSPQLPAVQ